jgi:hypothetical protein
LDHPDDYVCISVGKGFYPYYPIWSPDGRYLVVSQRDDEDEGPVILLDTVENWAAKIAEDAEPQGWVVHP